MRYEFGDCAVDTESYELRRVGERVKLRRKPFDLLVYLMTHAGQTLPKQELFDQVWSDRIISDATLNSCIKVIRQAIGDDGKDQTIIQTLHGFGYRFNASGLTTLPTHPITPSYHTLPNALTPFVGRNQELKLLLQQLATPECRLLTVIAPGGMGKTRLLLQAAHDLLKQSMARFDEGVYWVDLSAVHSISGIVSAVATSLGYQLTEADPQQQLCDYLATKRLLLVLDNFEQLKSHSTLLADWLTAAPGLTLLVSSRMPLELAQEWRFPLLGLSTESAEAHALFNSCAQRFDPQHDPQHPAIAQICQLLDGMPLAIEMAAAWLRLLNPDEIAQQLEQNLALLQVREPSIELRQTNMREVLNQSWHLLSASEQKTLRALAVFVGGFTLDAAQTILQTDLMTLAGLSDKALLQRDPNGRYRLHELIRQYANERLNDDSEQVASVCQQQSRYYLAMLNSQDRFHPKLLNLEFGNIQAAWLNAIEFADWRLLESSMEALFEYCSIGSRYAQGAELFDSARTAIPDHEAALQRGCEQRWMALRGLLGEQASAYRYFRECVERPELTTIERIFVHLQLGQLTVWQEREDNALFHLRVALAESQKLDRIELQAQVTERLAQILSHLGKVDEALQWAEKSLVLWRQLEQSEGIAYALDTLGFAAFCKGEFERAEYCYRESLEIFEANEDFNGAALALGGLGIIGSYRRIKAALGHLQRAVTLARQTGHRLHLSTRLDLLAWGCNLLSQHELALTAAQEGLLITQELGNIRYQIVNHYHCSEAALGLNDPAKSWHHLHQGLLLIRTEHAHAATRLLASCAHWLIRYAEQCHECERQPAYCMAERLLASIAPHPSCWAITCWEVQQLTQRLPQSLKKPVKIVNNNTAEPSLYELTQQCLTTYWAGDRMTFKTINATQSKVDAL